MMATSIATLSLVRPVVADVNVVVSIPPLASLVEGVMDGVGRPRTLVPPGASLHDFAMKPSDAAALESASVVFWVGPQFESFMEKPIDVLGDKARVIRLLASPGMTVHAAREGGVWEAHADEAHDDHQNHGHDKDEHDHDHDDHDHDRKHDERHDAHAHAEGGVDGHVWLDPGNAEAMVATIRDALVSADPGNASRYTDNAKRLASRIDDLDRELRDKLAPVKAKPFVVFHDAYQYFERHFGLNVAGSITVSPDRMPGAGRIGEVGAKIRTLNAVCVFAEPQFQPRLITTLVEGTAAKTGTLDPEGALLVAGPDLYFDLMRGIARNLTDCLAS